jgi:hypothetical protein
VSEESEVMAEITAMLIRIRGDIREVREGLAELRQSASTPPPDASPPSAPRLPA